MIMGRRISTTGKGWAGLLLLLPLLLLSSCGGLTSVTQPNADPEMGWTLSGGHSIGQTFVAHHDGLDGVELALKAAGEDPLPPLEVSLRSGPLDPQALVQGMAASDAQTADDWVRVDLPALPDSHGERFYLEVTWPQGSVFIPLGPGDAYQEGAAYLDGQAQEAQLVFRLTYDRGAAALGLLQRLVTSLPGGVVAILLLVLPGLALTAWLLPAGAVDVAGRLILSVGLSATLFPLVLLVARALGGPRLGPAGVWLLLITCAALVLWRAWPALRRGDLRKRAWDAWSWPAVCLGIVTALIFGVRLLVVSSLAAPMWGDSYQHTVIVQLLVDHGGLFDSWEPYAPFDTFTLHYGFHSVTSFFQWLTGVDVVQSVIVVGQVLNGVAALTLYPLAVRLSGHRWAGVAAVAIAGLLSPMPMHYLNWGRYSQLAGQAVLPVALWFLCEVLESPRWDARRLALAALAAAGMFLCYYRIGYFYATFALAWWLLHGLAHWRRDVARWLGSLARVAAVALGAGVLILPRVFQLSQGNLVASVNQQTGQSLNWQAILADYRLWQELDFYTPWPLLILAAAGLVCALVRRRWAVLSVGLWAAALASLMLTAVLGLPGVGMANSNFAVLIAWYMPVSLLGGWAVGEIAVWLELHRPKVGRAIVAGAILAASLWGAKERMSVVYPGSVMVTHADEAAMDWIAGHTAPDALFLVNGFGAYGDTSVVGADGGWWIPLLAERRTTLPPLYALIESPSEPGYVERAVGLVLGLQTTPVTTPNGQQVLCENGITHLYVGQGQGLVGNPGEALISAADVAVNPAFQKLYHQDRVWVFAFDRGVCSD